MLRLRHAKIPKRQNGWRRSNRWDRSYWSTEILLQPGDIVAAELDSESAGDAVIARLDPHHDAFAGDLELSAVAGVRQYYLQSKGIAPLGLHVAVKKGSQGVHVAQGRGLQLLRLMDWAYSRAKLVVQPGFPALLGKVVPHDV